MKKILTISLFVIAGFISSCDRNGTATSIAGSDLNANNTAHSKSDQNVQVTSANSTLKDKCQGERSIGCTCPQTLNQVCGCNGVTYDNGCYAQCDGVTSYTFGVCPGYTGGGANQGTLK